MGCLAWVPYVKRSEEHTSELQSRPHLVCRLLLEKKKPNDSLLYALDEAKLQSPIPSTAPGGALASHSYAPHCCAELSSWYPRTFASLLPPLTVLSPFSQHEPARYTLSSFFF